MVVWGVHAVFVGGTKSQASKNGEKRNLRENRVLLQWASIILSTIGHRSTSERGPQVFGSFMEVVAGPPNPATQRTSLPGSHS